MFVFSELYLVIVFNITNFLEFVRLFLLLLGQEIYQHVAKG